MSEIRAISGLVRPVPSAPFDLVVVAGSTGSFEVVRALLAALPAAFPVPLAVVRHVSARHPSLAVDLLGRRCALAVQDAVAGQRPRPGTVVIAPPDRHLLVRPGGRLTLEHSARVHFTRPAADPLFISAARANGARLLAIVLSGMGRDGAAGIAAVKAAGGVTIVQTPATCVAPMMPQAAIDTGCVDFILPPEALSAALISLCMVPGAAHLFHVPARALPLAVATADRPAMPPRVS